jgi:4-amino-4-deoxychorismate lyase
VDPAIYLTSDGRASAQSARIEGMANATLLLLTRPAKTNGKPSAHSAPGGGPGFVQVDAEQPQVSVMDLGVTRGDGLFESISIMHGLPQALEPHLRRLAHSASILDLPEPDLDAWRATVLAAIAAHEEASSTPTVELFAKLVMTRGIEGSDEPTGWVYVSGIDDFSSARSEGIRVVTLDRGYRHDVAQTSPWLLQGAKTLSYAVNKAALREATRRGADDVIFVSSDGFALEGPTANVIVRNGNLIRTPQTDQGILAGTTQASVFDFFTDRGFETSYEHIPASELSGADALWLVSSVRQAAPVRSLDGAELEVDRGLAADLNAYLLERTE